jgi:hypothetical protein
LGLGFGIKGLGFIVKGLELGGYGSGFRVISLESTVQAKGQGFGDWGYGLRVSGYSGGSG